MATNSSQNRFVVDLSGLNLSDVDRRAIAAGLQSSVLSYLAGRFTLPSPSLNVLDEGGIAGMYILDSGKSKPGPKPVKPK